MEDIVSVLSAGSNDSSLSEFAFAMEFDEEKPFVGVGPTIAATSRKLLDTGMSEFGAHCEEPSGSPRSVAEANGIAAWVEARAGLSRSVKSEHFMAGCTPGC